jgi:cell division septum initiation protein DivIVA
MKDLNAKTKKVKVNGKDVTDREELNNFLREVIKDINSYLQKIY